MRNGVDGNERVEVFSSASIAGISGSMKIKTGMAVFWLAVFSLTSSGGAEDVPLNWPKGYFLFECDLPDGKSERFIRAFYDDVGGNTWNKY